MSEENKEIDPLADIVEDLGESIMDALRRIKDRIKKSHKHHDCYEQKRAEMAVEGAIRFMEKSKKPIDDK